MPRDDTPTNEAGARDERADTPPDATPAVVVARSPKAEPDTTEIRALAAAAGYAVVGEITQRRREDPTYGIGRGAAEDLMRLAADTDAAAVIYDGSLSPGQTFSLGDLLPTGTAVIDRPRLALELFGDAADSRAAAVKLELARLRYELPRLRETVARDAGEAVRLRPEGDGRVRDLERRIKSAERDLDRIAADRERRREERRAAGFDLIAIAGYTDAGKSTLARLLADDEEVEATPTDPAGPDASGTDGAAGPGTPDTDGADRLFETRSTTTRRATLGGRRTVVTDTVGFLDGLPHESIRSFRATLDAVRRADCVLLVVDGSDDPTAVRRKFRASLSAIEATDGPVIPVLTKLDRTDRDGAAAVEALESVAADVDGDAVPVAASLRSPVRVDARDGTGRDDLADAIASALPTATAAVTVSNGGGAQSALSWAYDRGVVESAEYAGETVTVELAGRPDVVAEAERRLSGADDRSP
jgi:GTP-binding protein HflX